MKTIKKILWGVLFLCPVGIVAGVAYNMPYISMGAAIYMVLIMAVLAIIGAA